DRSDGLGVELLKKRGAVHGAGGAAAGERGSHVRIHLGKVLAYDVIPEELFDAVTTGGSRPSLGGLAPHGAGDGGKKEGSDDGDAGKHGGHCNKWRKADGAWPMGKPGAVRHERCAVLQSLQLQPVIFTGVAPWV